MCIKFDLSLKIGQQANRLHLYLCFPSLVSSFFLSQTSFYLTNNLRFVISKFWSHHPFTIAVKIAFGYECPTCRAVFCGAEKFVFLISDGRGSQSMIDITGQTTREVFKWRHTWSFSLLQDPLQASSNHLTQPDKIKGIKRLILIFVYLHVSQP